MFGEVQAVSSFAAGTRLSDLLRLQVRTVDPATDAGVHNAGSEALACPRMSHARARLYPCPLAPPDEIAHRRYSYALLL